MFQQKESTFAVLHQKKRSRNKSSELSWFVYSLQERIHTNAYSAANGNNKRRDFDNKKVYLEKTRIEDQVMSGQLFCQNSAWVYLFVFVFFCFFVREHVKI